MTTPRVPANLEPFVAAIGVEATAKLLEAFGGTKVYVPKMPDAASPLVEAVGMDAARALAKLWPGEYPRIPKALDWLIHYHRGQDRSIAWIARRLRCTDVTVWKHLTGRQRDQLDLFERPA
jgi:hypothetical protein